jgi:hypothetical protein
MVREESAGGGKLSFSSTRRRFLDGDSWEGTFYGECWLDEGEDGDVVWRFNELEMRIDDVHEEI